MEKNFEDVIGRNSGNCLFDQRKYFDKVYNKWRKIEQIQVKPTWKILNENKECDVVSVRDLEVHL